MHATLKGQSSLMPQQYSRAFLVSFVLQYNVIIKILELQAQAFELGPGQANKLHLIFV